MKVVIIDDNNEQLKFFTLSLKKIFASEEIVPLLVEKKDTLKDFIRKNIVPISREISYLITDYDMGPFNAKELCEELVSNPNTKNIAIICNTASSKDILKEKQKELWKIRKIPVIEKPITIDKLRYVLGNQYEKEVISKL